MQLTPIEMLFRQPRITRDALHVLRASSLLAVSEFQLFELAHRNWYGVSTDPKSLERDFVPYMFREQVPPYVRAFTRKVLALDEAGELDPRRFGIERAARTTAGVVSGLCYSALVLASVTVLVALAKVTAERLGLAECLFPPCF